MDHAVDHAGGTRGCTRGWVLPLVLSALACSGSDVPQGADRGDDGSPAADATGANADDAAPTGQGGDGSSADAGAGDGAPGGTNSDTSAPAPGDDATPMQVCRHYFETICARIRECNAPAYRACESPADLCPDALFAADSSWTAPDAVACAQTWRTHSCDELQVDRWPACSQRTGSRDDGADCVFDAQCQSGVCAGSVVRSFQNECGQCAQPAAVGDACADRTPCAMGSSCEGEVCVQLTPPTGECGSMRPCPEDMRCEDGTCTPEVEPEPLREGDPCTSGDVCPKGTACGIELAPEGQPAPDAGICQPLPPIGQPCLPTFGSLGKCEQGGTCTSRPTGDCVPLREIGESCGYTSCVAGAYCEIYSSIDDVESHTCHPLRGEGDPCFGVDEVCGDGLRCVCPDGNCDASTCTAQPEGAEPCIRGFRYGRVTSDCRWADETHECLCVTPDCTESFCAEPRVEGQSCNDIDQLCRQGFVCDQGLCTALDTLDVEASSCGG